MHVYNFKQNWKQFPGLTDTHIELAPESVGTSRGEDDEVGGAGQAQQKQDDEERPNKLHVPVPEVNMPHTQCDQQNAHQQTAEPENGQPLGQTRRQLPWSQRDRVQIRPDLRLYVRVVRVYGILVQKLFLHLEGRRLLSEINEIIRHPRRARKPFLSRSFPDYPSTVARSTHLRMRSETYLGQSPFRCDKAALDCFPWCRESLPS